MRALLVLAPLILGGCRGEPPAGRDTVVILVADGVRNTELLGEGVSDATGLEPWEFMPETWARLVPRGVRMPFAWNLGATTTVPAHVEILTGRRQAYANYPVNDGAGLYRFELPSLAESLRGARDLPQEQVLVIGNTDFVESMGASLWPGLEGLGAEVRFVGNASGQPSSEDELVVEAVKTALEEREARFVLANLHQVDRSAHYGVTSEEHLRDLEQLDPVFADFWDGVEATPGIAGRTWFLLATDHGRHTVSGDDPVWRHHGCACNGCRRVSLLLLGPGVRAGAVVDEPVLLSDLAPTFAAVLGVDLPWAQGRVLGGLFEHGPATTGPAGVADLAAAGGHRAEVVFGGTLAHRTEVHLDGVAVSDPEAILAEAPALAADGDRAWLCFRELVLQPEETHTPWRARCLETGDGGSTWADIGGPDDEVGPYWRPALGVLPDGRLLLVGGHNPNGTAAAGYEGGDGHVYVQVATWDGASWAATGLEAQQVTFPTDPAVAVTAEGLVLAVGAGLDGPAARHSRDVFVGTGTLAGTWDQTLRPVDLAAQAGEAAWRLERPALAEVEGVLWLAAVAHTEGGSLAVLARSEDGGTRWTGGRIVELPGPVLPHLSPAWLPDRAVFAVLDGQEPALCGVLTEGPATCVAVGSPRVGALAVDGDVVLATVATDDGSWEVAEVRISSRGAR